MYQTCDRFIKGARDRGSHWPRHAPHLGRSPPAHQEPCKTALRRGEIHSKGQKRRASDASS
eukprot:1471360-Pyramimonas_sp.AAC.1